MTNKQVKTMAESIISQPAAKNHISYEGIVKVIVKNQDKEISSKTYHNAGGTELFDFLLDCLTYGYDPEDVSTKWRHPEYVKLFAHTEDKSPAEVTGIDEDSMQVCPAIHYNSRSNIETSEDGIGRQITFHFTIPNAYLVNVGMAVDINQAALYSSKYAEDNNEKYCAFFNFVDELGEHWDPIEVSFLSRDYNIFIEWTLIIK